VTAATTDLVPHAFRAMNTDVELIAPGESAERRLRRAERWLHAFEARFSRFLATSELSRLNASAGRPFPASPLLFRLVSLALTLAERSGGRFDPTVLRALEGAGYDRSFERLAPLQRRRAADLSPRASWRQVRLDAASRQLTLPPDCGLDLGGIGKGWAVDRLAVLLGTPCLINAGGDVFAAGRPPDAPAWLVGVADPFDSERDLALLPLRDQGVATSTTLKRRWQVGDRWLHHLIDPRTGRPSDSDAVQVTAVAPTATLADYHAKVALLLGSEDGRRYLDVEEGVEGLVVRSDGALLASRRLPTWGEGD